METYAVEININNVAIRVIVGNAEWATATFGGLWIDSDTLVGVGWIWNGTTFEPPPAPDNP